MNIAITASGPSLENEVFADFSQTPYLLIVNVDQMECTAIEHTLSPGSDIKLAQDVVAHRCEAVITGKLTEAAFDLIADDGITRYAANKMSARQALDAMEKRALEIIRNAQGMDQCSGAHHH